MDMDEYKDAGLAKRVILRIQLGGKIKAASVKLDDALKLFMVTQTAQDDILATHLIGQAFRNHRGEHEGRRGFTWSESEQGAQS